MKVYVDKKPENCDNCPMMLSNSRTSDKLYRCNATTNECPKPRYKFELTGGLAKNCPLQLLQNHDKEVRKQFSNKLKKRINQCHKLGFSYDDDIYLVIDQIEKGE